MNELIKQQKLQEREKRQKESKREAAEKVRSQVKKFQMKIDYWRDKLRTFFNRLLLRRKPATRAREQNHHGSFRTPIPASPQGKGLRPGL